MKEETNDEKIPNSKHHGIERMRRETSSLVRISSID